MAMDYVGTANENRYHTVEVYDRGSCDYSPECHKYEWQTNNGNSWYIYSKGQGDTFGVKGGPYEKTTPTATIVRDANDVIIGITGPWGEPFTRVAEWHNGIPFHDQSSVVHCERQTNFHHSLGFVDVQHVHPDH